MTEKKNVNEAYNIARMVFKSGRYPQELKQIKKIQCEQRPQYYVLLSDDDATIHLLAMTIMRAWESGIDAITGLFTISYFNGRPCVYGDAAHAQVLAHPDYVSHSDTYSEENQAATFTITRRSKKINGTDIVISRTFSWKDAVQAGLAGLDHYQRYPARMLMIRARAWAERDAFADALYGMAIAEEQHDVELVKVKAETPPAEETTTPIDKYTANELELMRDRLEEKPNFEGHPAAIKVGDTVFANHLENQVYKITAEATSDDVDLYVPPRELLIKKKRKKYLPMVDE